MTPLHCAAMFDHPEIVEYLIQEGADINSVDKERRSPMLLAALRGGWRTVHTLIKLGADINIKDVNQRNVLHLVVMNGGRLEQFAADVSEVTIRTALLFSFCGVTDEFWTLVDLEIFCLRLVMSII